MYLLFFYFNFIFQNLICSCDGKADFQQSLLQSLVSRDLSEIILICWFADQETFLIIVKLLRWNHDNYFRII